MPIAPAPARSMNGVERVVIACDSDSSLDGAETATICAQLVKKAQAVTRLPVISIAPAKVASSVSRHHDQLVLHVALSAKLHRDRGTLALTVTMSRNYLNLDAGPPIKSEAQLATIAGKLVVQGPVRAFAQILAAAPPELHRPERSDS